ncbi:MAG: transglutaminase domain-containing protein [Oscillospiraceae bacterium]|nr:transglutaminase domain-containing protein [Oscillospiraceae bacterium]
MKNWGKWKRPAAVVLALVLICSLGFNIYMVLGGDSILWKTYLQSPEEIKIMELGVIAAHAEFREGEDFVFSYDFDHEEYPTLLEKYAVSSIAGNGSEFERASRLMNAFSKRLAHTSNVSITPDQMNALYLLEYSLDQKNHGIFCRAKSQILNEMCLALGIYARKVWINPISKYDSDCHVVNEVWDSSYNKWIMLDITNNTFWIDREGTPLSVLEIRDLLANNEFCTPAFPSDDLSNPDRLANKHIDNYLYIAKNMVYTYYLDRNTVGETGSFYVLFPKNLDTKREQFVSRDSVEAPPQKELPSGDGIFYTKDGEIIP